jgi:uncharacterized membrane protein YkoI
MKRFLMIALCVVGLSNLMFGAIVNSASFVGETAAQRSLSVSMEQARKAALQRVAGEVEDEWEDEDDDGNVIGYVFQIRKEDSKLFEVKVSKETGKVTSAEEVVEDEDPSVN